MHSVVKIVISVYAAEGDLSIQRSVDGGAYVEIATNTGVYYDSIIDETLPTNFSTLRYRAVPSGLFQIIYVIDVTIWNT